MLSPLEEGVSTAGGGVVVAADAVVGFTSKEAATNRQLNPGVFASDGETTALDTASELLNLDETMDIHVFSMT